MYDLCSFVLPLPGICLNKIKCLFENAQPIQWACLYTEAGHGFVSLTSVKSRSLDPRVEIGATETRNGKSAPYEYWNWKSANYTILFSFKREIIYIPPVR